MIKLHIYVLYIIHWINTSFTCVNQLLFDNCKYKIEGCIIFQQDPFFSLLIVKMNMKLSKIPRH